MSGRQRLDRAEGPPAGHRVDLVMARDGQAGRQSTAGRVALLATVVSLLSPTQAEGLQAGPSVQPTDTVLANGLRISVLENADAPLVSVLLGVRAGASTQRPGEAGIAHLYEHLLFRSYGSEPSSFAQEAGELNASFNGSTDVDVVTYSLVLPSERTEGAIELLGRLATRSRIRDRDLRAELPVVLDELARAGSNPSELLDRQVSSALWGTDWHRMDTSGDTTSLLAITVDDLQERFDRYYVPNNSILVVTGDARPREVFRWAADHLGDWDRGEDPIHAVGGEAPDRVPGIRAVLLPDRVLEATIQVQIRGPGTRDGVETVQAVEALVEVLDEPRGPLAVALVDNGPFRELSVGYRVRREAGAIVFVGTAEPDQALPAVSRLLGALEQLGPVLREPVPVGAESAKSGIERAIATSSRRWALDVALVTERTALLAGPLATLWGRGGGDYVAVESPFAESRGAEELAATADAYVHGQPKVLGLLAPAPVIEAFRISTGGGGR